MATEKEPKFENPAEEEKPEEGFKKEKGLWVPKEERGNIRSTKKYEELSDEEKEERARDYQEKTEEEQRLEAEQKGPKFIDKRAGARKELAEEINTVESAKIPEEGMRPEDILKEIGIEKPAESFEETGKRLKEELKTARVRGGEKLSEAEEIDRTRDFYLKELGYSLEYRGLLRGKARVLDSEGKYIVDEKGEPREFKAFFKLKKDNTPLIDFLKEELQGRFGKKTEEVPTKKTEEEKLDAGFREEKKGVEQKKEKRKEKISSLQDIKKTGKERLSKAVEKFSDVLSYLFVPDKLALLGLREGKKLAVEEGKDLAAADLTPFAAIEEAARRVIGRVQVGESVRKRFVKKEEMAALKEMSVEKRPDDYSERLLEIMTCIEQAVDNLIKGQDKLRKKGKLTKLVEMLQG